MKDLLTDESDEPIVWGLFARKSDWDAFCAGLREGFKIAKKAIRELTKTVRLSYCGKYNAYRRQRQKAIARSRRNTHHKRYEHGRTYRTR